MTKYAILNETDQKLYAFCMGGVATFYTEREQTHGRPLALCHLLGGLALAFCRTPTMMFLQQNQRHLYRQQLCEFGRRHMTMSEREINRPNQREMLDLAVEIFSAKPGSAKDVSFDERSVRTPEPFECQRVLEAYRHEYGKFIGDMRTRAMVRKAAVSGLRR